MSSRAESGVSPDATREVSQASSLPRSPNVEHPGNQGHRTFPIGRLTSPTAPQNNSFSIRQRSAVMSQSGEHRLYGHSHSTLAELEEAFHLIGEGNDFTTKELKQLFESLGQHPSEDELQQLVKNVNPDGVVSFCDFAALLGRHVEHEDLDQMSTAFHWLDPDRTGYISANDFCELFATWGEESSSEEVDELLAFADPKTGKIQYEEFLRMLAFRLR